MSGTAVVYYSLPGETVAPGRKIVNLEKGHTAAAAETIARAVGADLYGLETVESYAADHMQMVREAKEEFDRGMRRPLREYPDISSYDTVFVGFPNWFGTLPLPMAGFLERCDWSGKRLIPFVTSGGSGFARSLDDLKKYCPGAEIAPGAAFLGHEVDSRTDEIAAWARSALEG